MAATKSAKRVLVVCNDADYFLRHRLPVVRHLVSVGIEVAVIAGGDPIAADRIDGWTHIHTPIERFSFNPLSDAVLWLRTFKVVRSWRPDAVHLITMKPMVFSGLAAITARLFCGRPRRILITLPGLGRMMSRAAGRSGIGMNVARFLTEKAAQFLAARDGVHFSFETAHDRDAWLARGLTSAAGSTVVDGAGVDPQQFFPAPADRKPTALRVLFASRLLRSKGLDTFVEVARRFSGRPDIEFLVAGMYSSQDPDGLVPSGLEREGSIHFLGEVQDMPALLRSCDIVCLPTRYGEGIPRILIEAAATGLASIASDAPGCREVVVDGMTGRIVSGSGAGMVQAMQDALLDYVAHPARIRAHGAAAYKLFKSRGFGADTVASQFRQLLGV